MTYDKSLLLLLPKLGMLFIAVLNLSYDIERRQSNVSLPFENELGVHPALVATVSNTACAFAESAGCVYTKLPEFMIAPRNKGLPL